MQEMKQRHGRMLFSGLLPWHAQPAFLYNPKLPIRNSTNQSLLAPPISNCYFQIAYMTILWKQIRNWDYFLNDSSLWQDNKNYPAAQEAINLRCSWRGDCSSEKKQIKWCKQGILRWFCSEKPEADKSEI